MSSIEESRRQEGKVMQYQNPFWGMMNYDYVQQQMQQYHIGQIKNTYECAEKLRDFLDSTDKVAPEYQQAAWLECCAVLMDYYQKHNIV